MPPLTIPEILEAISHFTHVSELSMVNFVEYVEVHGLDDHASGLFQSLLTEEEEARAREINHLEALTQEIDDEMWEIEPGVAREMRTDADIQVKEYEKIADEYSDAYQAVATAVDESIHADQKTQDDAKIAAIKQGMGL